MSSREQFEAWFMDKYNTTADTMKVMQIKVELAWEAWQAASKASEQQLAAVIAECVRCKFEISRCHQTVDEMFKNRDKWVDKEWLSSIWSTSKRLMNETSATDAGIAKIQAQGVDAAIERLIQKFEGTGHIGVPVMVLEHFAAQLRQGAAL